MKPTSKLTHLQSTFYSELRSNCTDFYQEIIPMVKMNANQCLNIYRRGYEARLTEALGETFEACWWVLGDDDFLRLCKKYINENHSFFYDLSDYGNNFPKFLASQEECAGITFLEDLAKFEWIFKEAFHSPNAGQSSEDWPANDNDAQLSLFSLKNSHVLFSSNFSVYEIWKLRSKNIESLSDLDLNKSNFLLIKKISSQIYIDTIDDKIFFVLEKLANGLPIADVIEILVEKYENIESSEVQNIFSKIRNLNALQLKIMK